MADHDAFLQAIIDNPDDDAPRLIYADWLEENGEPDRADFIRVQCALALLGQVASPAATALAEREEELLQRHGSHWAPGISQLAKSLQVTFRRGFVMSVCAEARAFVAGAEELFRLAPVRHVQLYWGTEPPHERARFMQAVAAVRQLSRLQTLDLSDGFIGSDGVQALAVCEYLDSLESLDLRGGHIGERGVRALVEASWFANLLSLDLRNNDVNAAAVHALASGLAALARAGRLRLRKLVLEGNPLRQSGMRVIRASPELRRVAQL